jgi:DNA-3-methyladenine glycosylase II
VKNAETLKSAQQHFKNNDPIMGRLVDIIGDIDLRQRPANFDSFVRIIVNQQLSNKSAKTIFFRIIETSGSSPLTPIRIKNLMPEVLRTCGLSESKVGFVRNISDIFLKNPSFLDELSEMSTSAAYSELMKIKGIGTWSANIFLLFSMGKKDIFPYGDATLEKALNLLYGIKLNRRKAEGNALIENWSPFKSVAALYLWKWVDGGMPNPNQ